MFVEGLLYMICECGREAGVKTLHVLRDANLVSSAAACAVVFCLPKASFSRLKKFLRFKVRFKFV